MKPHDQVFEAIKRATGKDVREIRDMDESWFFINGAVTVVLHPTWSKPGDVEAELEGVLQDLRSLRRRIENLDRHALVLARQAQTADRDKALEAQLVEKAGDFAAINQLLHDHEGASLDPRNYVDQAALRHIQQLEQCLVAPIERAIAAAPTGRGRPKNRRAYDIADFAAQAYFKLTQKPPTFWNGGATPFSRLVDDLFALGGVTADPRKPIEAAMSKMRPQA